MVNVDTKLLVIFVELLSKRNATYVAEKMHMTAPAVSHSLGRLREIFDDPLFIRVPHGLTPTPKALELGPKVREMLDLWAAINEGDIATFDPLEAAGTFNINQLRRHAGRCPVRPLPAARQAPGAGSAGAPDRVLLVGSRRGGDAFQ